MTPEDAVKIAKEKILRGTPLDEYDVANLTHAVHQDGYAAGFKSAYREMSRLCSKYLSAEYESE